MESQIKQIRKRNGEIADFDQSKVTSAVYKSLMAVGRDDEALALRLSDQVVQILNNKFHFRSIPAIEEVQDIVEEVLIKEDLVKAAKAYIIYREQHARLRELKQLLDSNDIIEGYLKKMDWRVKENANMAYSLQGLNNHVASAVSAHYWLNKIYPPEIRNAHVDGTMHIHDLQILAVYCCGWDLQTLIRVGFCGVEGKVQSKPPKRFRSALGQVVNFFYTLQGEAAGAQAFASFDTLLAPFIRYEGLDYKQVKQGIQEFIFNMNVPTRVGFQCMSQDTEILTAQGWKGYKGVKEKDIIATFNTDSGIMEYLPVKRVFAREYKGKMYNLKNRISDQLISPEHRVVRRQFNGGGYVLEPIEKVLNLKSPFIVPVGSLGNVSGDNSLSDAWVKFLAWTIAEGTLDKGERGAGRVSIYQSKEVKPSEYEEIKALCEELGLAYTERTQTGLGSDCQVLRFDSPSTKKILKFFGGDKSAGIKFIPKEILSADTETARLFLETYIKGDGHDECKITTTLEAIKDDLLMVAANAGFGATVLIRKPDNNLSKKDRYIIRLIKHVDTYINEVKQVDYNGIIWCPNTDNETVIARRNGKIFITGNTPFTNLTFDLTCPSTMANEPVLLGGIPQRETYKEFQMEMNLINRAFAEVMMEGDAKGRVFTFPIPTYNISKDFDWDNEVLDPIWEMTAKYGIPYFANFVNSDMKAEDARSMCCRLRLDNRVLRKRGGGLFAANPLTGSIGVVTINLPRIGYLSKGNEQAFFSRLSQIMELSRQSLKLKRNVLENFTDMGLYPYARFYLSEIKERFGQYWRNHFNTIGINGMNETIMNFLGKPLSSKEGGEFAEKIMDFMLSRLVQYQEEDDQMYNLEATPAEGATYRFAKKDKELYPDIIVANEEQYRDNSAAPYYTNSSHFPVNYSTDIFDVLEKQDGLQIKYTGGTVVHIFLGEKMPDIASTKNLVKKVAESFRLPYYTLTPTFSVCPKHGYLAGEHRFCPVCDDEIGYIREQKEKLPL
ncbi:MAG: ribonucleoside triphosphate reductase [Candidatus Buchananbacteria bacterium]|jgi:ribonucleoside-triphosphate reductase